MLTQSYARLLTTKRLSRELRTIASLPASPHAPSSLHYSPPSSWSIPSNVELRRGHFVVKRRWWLPHIPNLDDVKNYPYDEHERGDFHVYDEVAATHEDPRPDIRLILTKYVEGYGDVGDAISVSPSDARDYLVPAQLAIYDTPENRQRMRGLSDKLADRVQRTPFAALTGRELETRLTLPIVMNPNVEWKLEKFHVIVALRKVGVVVESEDCVELPEEEVTRPADVNVYLTINGTDRVKIATKVVHWYIDLDGNVTHDLKNFMAKPVEREKFWWGQEAEPVTKTK